MVRGYTPQQFVALFGTPADRQVEEMFTAELGVKCLVAAGVNDAAAAYEK